MTRPIRLALAAVAACASSRCSSAARHPAINPRGARSRSGSIRHDHARRPPESRSFVNRSIGRSRASASRAHQIRSSSARSSPASNNNGSNRRPSLNPKRPNRYRATTVGCRRSVRNSQIPIARHRCSGQSPAGSFLGGFRTTAPLPVASPTMGPSSETLHRSGHRWRTGFLRSCVQITSIAYKLDPSTERILREDWCGRICACHECETDA
jgi:hypothetical protein